MWFRSKIYIPFALLVLFGVFPGCADDDNEIINIDAQEIVISTSIYGGSSVATRAVAAVGDYVGRGIDVQNSKEKDFESGDKIKLTLIKRTDSSIEKFTYKDVDFLNTAGSWDRITADPDAEDRIYWSDANNPHTFKGYSLPIVARSSGEGNAFEDKWKSVTPTVSETIFYSCIGDPTNGNETIDFTSEYNNDKTETVSGNSKIKKEDLLLTYNIEQKAEPGGSVAKLVFRHALANVRVIVNIRGFAATSDAMDTRTRVSDLMLKNMPMMYKWDQKSFMAEPLTSEDATVMTSLGWNKDLKKDIKTWMPHPEGVGEGVERTFTFYALAVPGSTNLVMPFTVTYPKPLNPTVTETKDYEATINNVVLKAGYCTTINISLNHSNEEMTVGATYIDWEFVEIPDRGVLRKNSVFLESIDRSKITIVGDKMATNYDAIWLYNELNEDGTPKTDTKGNQIIKDIYGHTGDTKEDAYQISTAQQFLSFAYEVQGKERGSENGSSLSGGMDFTGKYIKLDADIYLQESRTSSALYWVGIGDDTHAFNGTFLGGGRIISRLKDKALFVNLGNNAVVDLLSVQDIIDIGNSNGALAEENKGKIIGCKINSDVKSESSNYIGSIAGTNYGTIEACYHLGDIVGKGAVAGLAGQNAGSIIGCYNAGIIKTEGTNYTIYGVTSVISDGSLTNCYFDKSLAKDVSADATNGRTTIEMQKQYFVHELNSAFNQGSEYSYVFVPTMYPSLGPWKEEEDLYTLSDGFYRVKNIGSGRYVYVTDNKGHYTSSSSDLDAIVLRKGISNAISDPASIIYVTHAGSGKYDFIGQGVSLYELTKQNAVLYPTKGYYRVGASKDNITVHYLFDTNANSENEYSSVSTVNNDNNIDFALWDALPVSSSSLDNYFGIKPTVSVNDKNYAPFYAGFGFEPASNGMEVFYISQLNESEGKVCLKKITGVVPPNTPVIVTGSSNDPSSNRLYLKNNNATFNERNFLKGNMFNFSNSSVPGKVKNHNSRVQYDPTTMRVLGVNSGKLAFVKKTTSELQYLPANQSYLVVSPNAPDVIYVEWEETYNGNTSGGSNTNNPIASGYYRVRNFGSQRYISVMDNKVTINVQKVNVTHDLNALELKKTLDYTDPASIIYVTENGDVTSQGVSLQSRIPDFTINERKIEGKTHYRVGAERDGLSRYICDSKEDNEENGKMNTYVTSNPNYLLWDAVPIENESNYFGIKPSVTVTITNEENSTNETKYFSSFYAEFGFEVPTGMIVYVVDGIETTTDEDSSTSTTSVILKPLTESTTIPNKMPVIVECSSETANSNKVSLKYESSPLNNRNLLRGIFFNSSISGHVNRTKTTANMRVLAVDNGNLVFKKPEGIGTTYLPANSSYLIVGDDVPETLPVVFKNN